MGTAGLPNGWTGPMGVVWGVACYIMGVVDVVGGVMGMVVGSLMGIRRVCTAVVTHVGIRRCEVPWISHGHHRHAPGGGHEGRKWHRLATPGGKIIN